MNSEQYKGLNKGYINYSFIIFSDLELSFWFEVRYSRTAFCKMRLKARFPFQVSLILLGSSCDQVFIETKRVILAKFVDFDVTLTNVLP